MQNICVLGAGVVGLSCAMTLAENYKVTLVADRFGIETDSIKATAIWHVYLVPETPRVLGWAAETLTKLNEIAAKYTESGIELINGVELYRTSDQVTPSWSYIPRRFLLLTEKEIATFNQAPLAPLTPEEAFAIKGRPVTWGYHIEAPAADMAVYLKWLEGEVRSKVNLIRKHLSRIDEIPHEFDAIVNCCGFGSRELVGDNDFEPYKGQYFVLRNNPSGPTTYIGDDEHPLGMAYMIPRGREVMVGGCAEKGLEDMDLTLDMRETLRRAGLYVPWLLDRGPADQARSPVVGIRPCRLSGVRLELDADDSSRPIIHNYGHGGSGFSLSWGCANEVARMLDNL